MSGKEYGKVWVGQTSDAADGITEINLANTNHFAYTNSWGNTFGDGGNSSGFLIRRRDGVLSGDRWGAFVAPGAQQSAPGEGHRFNVVKYDSPTIAGFTASAAWGEDDRWNIALRYKGEFSGFELAGGAAYTESNDFTTPTHVSSVNRGVGPTSEVGLSGSILHTETGLYASGAWGRLHDAGLDDLYRSNGVTGDVDEDTSFWTLQAGIQRKFIPLGATTFFGEYFQLDRGAGFQSSTAPLSVASLFSNPTGGTAANFVSSSELRGWSIGLNQNLSGVVDVYLDYKHVDIDVTAVNGRTANTDPIQFFTAGAQIKF
ncbi:porin [Hyphomicrobium sp. MC1]|uniref:porin n=1 Tax=Hyphomicrobium sp. (strain MC1) TaxID=717785 RepID=UPI001FCC0B66|nr:porin [Hyphomicrobium sp. MC1]